VKRLRVRFRSLGGAAVKLGFGPTRAQLELRELNDDELLALEVAIKRTLGSSLGVDRRDQSVHEARGVAYRPGRVDEN